MRPALVACLVLAGCAGHGTPPERSPHLTIEPGARTTICEMWLDGTAPETCIPRDYMQAMCAAAVESPGEYEERCTCTPTIQRVQVMRVSADGVETTHERMPWGCW